MKKYPTPLLWKRLAVLAAAVAIGCTIGGAYYIYDEFYRANVNVPSDGAFLYIPTGATIVDVVHDLSRKGYVKDLSSFARAADKLVGDTKIYSGRYKIMPGMGNKSILRMLTAGLQTPVNVRFGSVRTMTRFAGVIAAQLEPDSLALLYALTDDSTAARYGFTTATFPCMFVPNTYQMYWNVSLDDFLQRMSKEWNRFWETGNRDEKLQRLCMSRQEVSTLASIVAEETNKVDEMPIIAGVYVNRLRLNMPLQADPTARFATGDFTVHRILRKHTQILSPYNTYVNRGLPPGPICLPPVAAIDAVLNYAEHTFLYFCAKPDFSGYHTFAKTFVQHSANAYAFRRALNKRGVFR